MDVVLFALAPINWVIRHYMAAVWVATLDRLWAAVPMSQETGTTTPYERARFNSRSIARYPLRARITQERHGGSPGSNSTRSTQPVNAVIIDGLLESHVQQVLAEGFDEQSTHMGPQLQLLAEWYQSLATRATGRVLYSAGHRHRVLSIAVRLWPCDRSDRP